MTDNEDDLDDHDDDGPALEHDVLLRMRLSNRALGTSAERTAIEELADQLEEAVLDKEVGEYDGDEIGGGECVLFFAGADADRLLAVLSPILKRHPMGRTAKVTIQRGSDSEPLDVKL